MLIIDLLYFQKEMFIIKSECLVTSNLQFILMEKFQEFSFLTATHIIMQKFSSENMRVSKTIQLLSTII